MLKLLTALVTSQEETKMSTVIFVIGATPFIVAAALIGLVAVIAF